MLQKINYTKIFIRLLIGAAIGLIVISLFIFPVQTQVDWGKHWRIRPLIVTPAVSGLGGLAFCLPDFVRSQPLWKRLLAYLVAVIAFLVALWVGIILGLDGTLWD